MGMRCGLTVFVWPGFVDCEADVFVQGDEAGGWVEGPGCER